MNNLEQIINQANEALEKISTGMFSVVNTEDYSCTNGEFKKVEELNYVENPLDVFSFIEFSKLGPDAEFELVCNDRKVSLLGSACGMSTSWDISISCEKIEL